MQTPCMDFFYERKELRIDPNKSFNESQRIAHFVWIVGEKMAQSAARTNIRASTGSLRRNMPRWRRALEQRAGMASGWS